MREILFRGKEADDGSWVYGWHCRYPFGRWPLKDAIIPAEDAEDGYHRFVEVDGSTVGQFTGMTDKKGKNIFEGDIVMKRTYHGKTMCRVIFSYGCFHCGFGGGSSTATHPYLLDDKQIEVVGNIYDNPELLE